MVYVSNKRLVLASLTGSARGEREGKGAGCPLAGTGWDGFGTEHGGWRGRGGVVG